jgi:hypothetical protein
MHCIVRRVASSMGAAMKMLITVALGMGLISDIARAAEKPVYLSCHGKKNVDAGVKSAGFGQLYLNSY